VRLADDRVQKFDVIAEAKNKASAHIHLVDDRRSAVAGQLQRFAYTQE